MNLLTTLVMVLSTRLPAAPPEVISDVADAIEVATRATGHDARFAIELAELAALESGLAPWVLNGDCNRASWRATHISIMRGTTHCDGGRAFGAWQVHQDGEWAASDLLNVHTAALIIARRWAASPAAWTPWRIAKRRASAWRVEP